MKNKILIINVDSTIPNLAIEKIKLYHSLLGDEVTVVKENLCVDKRKKPIPTMFYDKVYVSCIFNKNRDICEKYEGFAEIGGSGYDIAKKLPPEIDRLKPKINMGFTLRGCIRKCPFCIVPKKEGKPYVENDIYDIWDGKSKHITLLDNNILADPDHFIKIAGQLTVNGLAVDFNQGLDHRLLDDYLTKVLLSLRHFVHIRFAFDNIAYEKSVIRAFRLLYKYGYKPFESLWYVFVGDEDTFENVYYRVQLLRRNGAFPYVMRSEKAYPKPEFIYLSKWTNKKTFCFQRLEDVVKTYGNWEQFKSRLTKSELNMVLNDKY